MLISKVIPIRDNYADYGSIRVAGLESPKSAKLRLGWLVKCWLRIRGALLVIQRSTVVEVSKLPCWVCLRQDSYFSRRAVPRSEIYHNRSPSPSSWCGYVFTTPSRRRLNYKFRLSRTRLPNTLLVRRFSKITFFKGLNETKHSKIWTTRRHNEMITDKGFYNHLRPRQPQL